jgi:hypothetical protein
MNESAVRPRGSSVYCTVKRLFISLLNHLDLKYHAFAVVAAAMLGYRSNGGGSEPTRPAARSSTYAPILPATSVWRRKLNSKAEVESSTSQLSFKRLVPASRRFQLGFDRVKLHRPTSGRLMSTCLPTYRFSK